VGNDHDTAEFAVETIRSDTVHEQLRRTRNPDDQDPTKVSGTMRTEKGAQHFADLRSYLQTTAKHGIQALTALTQLTSRNPWLPGYP